MENKTQRETYQILVPEAHALGAIAVIRSLGSAGYRVHACSSERDALGLRSNFAEGGVVAPQYGDPDYLDWLRDYLRTHAIDAIVPSEGFLHAIEPAFDEFKHLMPLPQSKGTAYAAFSKIDVLEALISAPEELGWRPLLPPSLIVRRGQAMPGTDDIEALGGPYFLKGDARDHMAGNDSLIQRFETAEAAQRALAAALKTYQALLLQGWVGGVKAAASFCLDHETGRPVCETGVLGIRTTPHRGGMMTYRQSWRHAQLGETALAWLHQLNWRGVAMVECKWDPKTDQFWLIEVNPRYWGYLHLDLLSGTDVPRLQLDRFFGLDEESVPEQTLGVRCRHTFPGDASALLSLLKDADVGAGHKIAAAVRFIVDFADFGAHSDLLFPGDRHLYWRQLGQYVRLLGSRVRQRFAPTASLPRSQSGKPRPESYRQTELQSPERGFS